MYKSLEDVKKAALQDNQVLKDMRFVLYEDNDGIYRIQHVGECPPPGKKVAEYSKLNGPNSPFQRIK